MHRDRTHRTKNLPCTLTHLPPCRMAHRPKPKRVRTRGPQEPHDVVAAFCYRSGGEDWSDQQRRIVIVGRCGVAACATVPKKGLAGDTRMTTLLARTAN